MCRIPLILFLVLAAGIQNARADELPSITDTAETISERLTEYWNKTQTTPAPVASDAVFGRRIYLDLAGRIPSNEELHNYVADERPDKRQQLINLLVNSEDYVQHMADIFDTLLMGRTDRKKYDQRQSSQWRAYLERVFRENRPWNEVVNEILLARPESQDDRGSVWFLYERNNKPQEIAEAIAPAFFGIRIECAQCHDHMVAHEIEQAHYWGLVAFFNRSENKKTKNGVRIAESAIGGFSEFASLDGHSYPNLLTFFESKTIEEDRPDKDTKQKDDDSLYTAASQKHDPRVPKFSRREQFVSEIATDHPLVARAFVNRAWAMLMGRGIVHPFDEMDSVHPPSHPKLLDWLAEDFRSSNYDIRRLIAMIALNDAYCLQSIQPEGVDNPASFAWYLERSLTAEQIARSTQLAIRGHFRNDHEIVAQTRDTLTKVMPDENVTTIKEALFLTNNEALNSFIEESNKPDQLPIRLRAISNSEKSDLMVQTLFGRSCRDEERAALEAFLGDDSADISRIRMALWSLLTSAEFQFNH